MQLTRDAIVTAALDIVDQYGLADMTMRRVASRLGVAPGALYWHVANKQELIAAVASVILEPVMGASIRAPHAIAEALHSALLSHRDGAEIVATALAQPGTTLFDDLLTKVCTTLPSTDAGRTCGAALVYLVMGAATQEQGQRQLAEATKTDMARNTPSVKAGVDLLLAGLNAKV